MTDAPPPRTYADKLAPSRQKKLLALDGGGIRGLISVEYLARIEDLLRRESGRGEDFVLADYFDYIAGTSTGGIIATCLALGMSTAQVREFYRRNGRAMFDQDWIYRRFLHRYSDANLAELLKLEIGEDTQLGSDRLRSLLMVVLRNATTDSPWPLSNNPGAKFNDPSLADCNLRLPLWQVVRASTAAPTFFPPEVVKVGARDFVFVDGGVTVYNNPAFQLFLMATAGPYRLGWPTGEDRLLLVSVGTGAAPAANEALRPGEMNLLYNASSVPSALMTAAAAQQDMLCRTLGRCLHGDRIDAEVGDLKGTDDGLAGSARLFTYVRYNVDLSRQGLDRLGLGRLRPEDAQKLDGVDHIDDLGEIGRTAGGRDVDPEHFKSFPA